MKKCPNCHNETDDLSTFCPVCGTMLDAIVQLIPEETNAQFSRQMPVMEIPKASSAKYDCTANYSESDILENRIPCMCVYLLGAVGVIIALLMASDSPYTRFHVIQSLKFTVLEVLTTIISVVLCWTVLVPILGAIALLVLMIAKFACFLDVIRNKATVSPLLHSIRFLN